MSWPTDTCTTTYLDAGTDDPSQARAEIKTAVDAVKAVIAGRGTASGVCDLDASTLVPASRLSSTAITTALGYTPWHPGNDGSGSTLDADTVDGAQAADFVKKDGTVAMTGDLNVNSNDLDNIKTATFIAEVDNGSSGSTKTIDWNSGQNQKVTLSAACTFSFTAPLGPAKLTLKIVSGGNYDPSWPTSSPGKVWWPGGLEPTWSTTAGKWDIATWYYDGTDYHGAAMLGYG